MLQVWVLHGPRKLRNEVATPREDAEAHEGDALAGIEEAHDLGVVAVVGFPAVLGPEGS